MTREETIKILGEIVVMYPTFLKSHSNEDRVSVVTLWSELFEDNTYEEVSNALKTYLCTSKTGYSPTIGHLKENISIMKGEDDYTALVAWTLVRRAVVEEGKYSLLQAFQCIPYAAREIIGDPKTLEEWREIDLGVLNTVVMSSFIKSYEKNLEIRKMKGNLPKKLLESCKFKKDVDDYFAHAELQVRKIDDSFLSDG